MQKNFFLFVTLTALTATLLNGGGVARAQDSQPEQNMPVTPGSMQQAVDTAQKLKQAADAKRQETEAIIRAMENGEPLPSEVAPQGAPQAAQIPAEQLQESLNRAGEMLKNGDFEGAKSIALQVLNQDPDSKEAQSIFNKAQQGLGFAPVEEIP